MSENPFLGMSEFELQDVELQLRQAREAKKAKPNVVATIAMRWAYKVLKDGEALGPAFDSFNHQALPKAANAAKPAGLSETEIKGIEDAVTSALEKAAKG